MRLFLPIPLWRSGGVEQVIISLIRELAKLTDQLILVLPEQQIQYLKTLIPQKYNVVYHTLSWSSNSWQAKYLSILQKLRSYLGKLKIQSINLFLEQQIKDFKSNARLQYLVDQYQATHCLYLLSNRLPVPTLNIPLIMLSHDLFWHYAPLTYPESLVQDYDASLLNWLNTVDLVLTNSKKTKQDLLDTFPQFQKKVEVIPLSGSPTTSSVELDVSSLSEVKKEIIFYFPSSFGIYKDQLTLIKAGIILAQKELEFKIIFSGKETDKMLSKDLALSQQKKTREYENYIQELKVLFEQYPETFTKHFMGLGYCSYDTVEQTYQQSACVVMPSRYEGFGLAIAEAVIRGLPVIAADLDVFREQVDLYRCEDRVQFFPPQDVTALAQLMENFIFNPVSCLNQDVAKSRFSHWTWHHVAQHYVKVLDKLSKG